MWWSLGVFCPIVFVSDSIVLICHQEAASNFLTFALLKLKAMDSVPQLCTCLGIGFVIMFEFL